MVISYEWVNKSSPLLKEMHFPPVPDPSTCFSHSISSKLEGKKENGWLRLRFISIRFLINRASNTLDKLARLTKSNAHYHEPPHGMVSHVYSDMRQNWASKKLNWIHSPFLHKHAGSIWSPKSLQSANIYRPDTSPF